MSDAGRPTHSALNPRSARSPSTEPSARRDRADSSPRPHGSDSTSQRVVAPRVAVKGLRSPSGAPCVGGLVAGADSSPRTFSITTHSGCNTSIAVAMFAHNPDRVPGASPACFPTVETSWQGNPPQTMYTGGTVVQSMAVISPRFGTSGQ